MRIVAEMGICLIFFGLPTGLKMASIFVSGRHEAPVTRKNYFILSGEGGAKVKLGNNVASFILIIASYWAATASAAAQARGGAVTIRYATLSPFVALLAGILILLIPRLLNYIVAIYLILIGLIGIFGV